MGAVTATERTAALLARIFGLTLHRLNEPAARAFARCRMWPLTDEQRDLLADIPAEALDRIAPATIRLDGAFFVLDDSGDEAFVTLAYHTNLGLYWAILDCGVPAQIALPLATETRDLVAFHPATPGRWALLEGRHDCLGEPGDPAEPVRVWRTPLAWLRAGCHGICPLTEDGVRLALSGGYRFIAEDRAHAAYLGRVCAQPFPLPRIDAA